MTHDEIAIVRKEHEQHTARCVHNLRHIARDPLMAVGYPEMLETAAVQLDLTGGYLITLLVEIGNLRALLSRVLQDDKLELSDGTLADIGDVLGTSA